MLIDYLKSAFSKGISVVYGILILKSLALLLEANDFADYYMYFNASLYAYTVFYGLQNAVILRFYYILEKDKLSKIVRSLNTLTLIFGCTIICAGIMVAKLDLLALLYTLILTITFGLFNNELCYFRIVLKFSQLIYFQIYQLLIVALGIYICKSCLSYKDVLLVVGLSYFIPIFIYRKFRLSAFFAIIDWNLIKENLRIIKYAIPTIIVALMTFAIASMNQYILNYFGYHDELAGYIANYYIAEKSVVVFLSVIAMVYIPVLFKKYSRLELSTFKDLFKIILVFTFFSCLMIGVLFFIHEDLTMILSSKVYITWSWVIPYIAIGGLFLGINSILSEVFTIAMKTNVLMYTYLLGGGLNFICNVVTIPHFGIVGAVVTTIFSYVGMLLFTSYFAYREYKKLKNKE